MALTLQADRPCDAGRASTTNTGGNGFKQCDAFAGTQQKATAAWQHVRWCRAFEFPLCAAAVRQARLGVHAINRLSIAPRSGMGSGGQSAAEEGRRMQDGHRHQAKTPPGARADRLRLTLFNTITK